MYTEFELYQACLNRDERGQREVFRVYLPMLHAVSQRYCGNESEAEDLTQESFIRAFHYIDRFKWNGNESFEKWLRKVFVNNAINAYKKKKRNNELNFSDSIDVFSNSQSLFHDDDSVIDIALDKLSFKEIMECVSQLPEQFRIVFNLFAVEEMKHKEIAELLGIPLKTSTTRYLRAKAKLKQLIEQKLKLANQQRYSYNTSN